MALIAPHFKSILSADKINKVVEVCNRLGFNPNWLLAVMFFETGRTFSPSKRNSIGSVGLIQFTRDKKGVEYKTIGGKKYMLDDLAKMSFIEQMDVVEAYYKEAKGIKPVKSFIDCYLVTFFPAALGKPSDYLLATKYLSAELIATQNPAFDINKDKKILKHEVEDYFRKLYNSWGFNFDADINYKKAGSFAKVALIALLVFFYTAFTVNVSLTENPNNQYHGKSESICAK